MAKKETFVQPLDYIVTPSGLTDGAKEAYKFITEADKTAADFVEKRAALADSISELATYMRWCKVVAESIQAGLKSCMEVAPESLPAGVSWEAQTYQTKFSDCVAAARALAELCGKDVAEFTVGLSPTQAMKIAGIDEAKLVEAVGNNFVKTPKARVLNVK